MSHSCNIFYSARSFSKRERKLKLQKDFLLLLFLSSELLKVMGCCLLQVKYKEGGLKSLSHSVYSQLPETTQTQLARNLSELQSSVRTQQEL